MTQSSRSEVMVGLGMYVSWKTFSQRALVLAENGVITASNILIDNALEPVGEGPQRTMIDAFRQSVAQA